MQKRRINVSSKSTISPSPFSSIRNWGIESEVECFIKDGALVIQPVQDISGAFAVEILSRPSETRIPRPRAGGQV